MHRLVRHMMSSDAKQLMQTSLQQWAVPWSIVLTSVACRLDFDQLIVEMVPAMSTAHVRSTPTYHSQYEHNSSS